jgi:hypothetical protein
MVLSRFCRKSKRHKNDWYSNNHIGSFNKLPKALAIFTHIRFTTGDLLMLIASFSASYTILVRLKPNYLPKSFCSVFCFRSSFLFRFIFEHLSYQRVIFWLLLFSTACWDLRLSSFLLFVEWSYYLNWHAKNGLIYYLIPVLVNYCYF